MDTEGIKLFVLAAEKLNISAAGRELGMPPAVASARLAKLEKAVGADLLRRSTRKVALSIEGAEFLPFAREILAQENAAMAAMGFGNEKVSGTLRFTASSTFAQQYIVPLVPEFLEMYPGINLDLRLSDMELDLIQGSFDLALRDSVLPDSNLKARKLAEDRRIFCASPDYLAKWGCPQSPRDLSAHQLIAFKTQAAITLMGPNGEKGEFNPRNCRNRLIIDDGLSYKIATMAGAGIAMHALWSVHHELSTGALVQLLPEYRMDSEPALWLVYPKSNVLTAKVRVFIDFLLQRIGERPPWLEGFGGNEQPRLSDQQT
ncbi:LysR family transcriptional regulator [Marinobacter nauticus]|uniref:LysR family transcriptional regulator n=1 Tax=Marinobacter nauticus TaxID=2743 RepID=UPI001C591F03|nr:LysR family transcriptional regulator [Marinobacter nauticus]MBW3196318.1 LysR family transcriptional regulator [Marinobacter nauticus]MBY6181728.1 LysR family transcriptional regulator [Marinobacter nauticus]